MVCLNQSHQLNILHLVPSIGRRSWGLGPVAVNLTREQRQRQHHAAIWCLDPPSSLGVIASEHDLDANVVSAFRVAGPFQIGFSPAMEQAVTSTRGGFYAVLHQHGVWMAHSRVTNRWRKTFGRPTIVAPHGELKPYALARSAWKKKLAILAYDGENLRRASCLHATSASEAMSFRQYGLDNPIAIIPNGISANGLAGDGNAHGFRERLGLKRDRRLLLYISRLHPIKGLPLLFEAMSSMRRELDAWCLVICGPDEVGHRAELESLAHTLHLDDIVSFMGPVFGDDKRNAFAGADVFVLPTHSENSAIIVMEALGAGIPVITTRGAPWEELRTRDCGWWVDISADAIKEALAEAIRRPQEDLRKMGTRGRALVSERYTWAAAAAKSLDVYEWLLGRAGRPECVVTD